MYHLGYQTEQIPPGFVSVAISGGFGENLPNLTGLCLQCQDVVNLVVGLSI